MTARISVAIWENHPEVSYPVEIAAGLGAWSGVFSIEEAETFCNDLAHIIRKIKAAQVMP